MTDTQPALTLEQIADLLQATVATLRAELEPLGEDGLRWHPAPGEWCINAVLGHLLEAERRGFAGRIQRIVEQPGRRLQTWDQAGVAKERRDCDKDGLELLSELEDVRKNGLGLIGSLRPEQRDLSGDHPEVGELRVRNVLNEWVHHDRSHVKQILTNVQAYVWPHMGNSQRFSDFD